jgi:S-adenosylmethionine synthetase
MRTAITKLPGHPDEACDLVAEAIVDEYLRRDPESRVRLFVSGGRGVMFVAGDILSQADFDVSTLVKRTLGSLGVTDEVEPFVSLEPVTPERVSAFRLPTEMPVTVTGYATNETASFVPRPMELSRRLAKALSTMRENDPDCFWLGPDAEISVMENGSGPMRVSLRVEHGVEPLERIREVISKKLSSVLEGAEIEVNPAGPCERRGLALASGASGRARALYGSGLPMVDIGIGRDPMSVEKAGTWLARAAAIRAVRAGAKAALVQVTYMPGEMRPASIRIRDERGRDLASSVTPEDFSLERVMKEWWRSGLNVESAQGGVIGNASFPWES